MKPEKKNCPELDTCFKVRMVLDHDLDGDWQYAQAIKAVCAKCDKEVAMITGMPDHSPFCGGAR